MRKFFNIFVGAFFIVSILVSSVFSQEVKPAADFTLEGLNKEKVTLSQYKNKKPVILIFWTTWCPFCMNQLKGLNEKYAQIKADGIEVLAINIGESADRIKKFAANKKYLFKIFLDEDSSVAEKYEVVGIPLYKIIDKSGNIVGEDNSLPDYKKLLK